MKRTNLCANRVKPKLGIFFIFIFMAFGICLSSALDYSVSYSGGNWWIDTGTMHYNGPYSVGSGGWYGAGPTTPLDCGVSGDITVTFTWVPGYANEPPPKTAIVEEACVAQYASSPGSSGTADNSLGDAVVVTPVGTDQHGVSGTYSGGDPIWHPWVKDHPGLSFSFVRAPSASVTTTGTPPGGSVGVSYQAITTPVRLTLSGPLTSNDGNYDVLVGQGVTGTLSVGSVVPASYSWTIPGNIFKDFAIASDQSTGTLTPFPGSDLTIPHPHWYWAEGNSTGASKTITCTAAVVVDGKNLSVYDSRIVRVWEPYFEMSPHIFSGVAYLSLAVDSCQTENPSTGDPAISFEGGVGTPDLFASVQGYGQWLFAQLCNISRKNSSWGSPLFTSITTSGQYWLDNTWGYAPDPLWETWPADSTATVPDHQVTDDSPENGFIAEEDEFKVNDKFKMYEMFLPPGTDSRWVPLAVVQWKWTAHMAAGSLTGWPVAPGDPVPGSSVSITSSTTTSAHPTWTHVFFNSP